MSDTTDTPIEMTGTPITRSGGYLIRVGWRAVGYSVDRDTESRYRIMRGLLFILALVLGVATAVGAEYVFFKIFSPLASEYLPWIKNSPELWRLVIYGLTLMFGGLIYGAILSSAGKSMMKGRDPFDKGYSLIEQRRRGSFKRKRVLLPLLLLLLAVHLAPVEMGLGLKLFLTIVLGYFFAEGLYFKLFGGSKKPSPKH